MNKYDSIPVSIAVFILVEFAYWLGTGDGRNGVCDNLRAAFLDNSRIPAVVSNELGTQYVKEIYTDCRW